MYGIPKGNTPLLRYYFSCTADLNGTSESRCDQSGKTFKLETCSPSTNRCVQMILLLNYFFSLTPSEPLTKDHRATTPDSAYNEGWQDNLDETSSFLCITIIDNNVTKFTYNEQVFVVLFIYCNRYYGVCSIRLSLCQLTIYYSYSIAIGALHLLVAD